MSETRGTEGRTNSSNAIDVHAVYLKREDRRDERLLAVVLDESECHKLHQIYGLDDARPLVSWTTHKLIGPRPDPSRPIETVYVVSSGGIDDTTGNSGFPPTVLGVYTTRQTAEKAKRAQDTHDLTIRAVTVGAELPAEFAIDLYESTKDGDEEPIDRVRARSDYGVPLKRVWSPFKIWQIRRELRKIGIEPHRLDE